MVQDNGCKYRVNLEVSVLQLLPFPVLQGLFFWGNEDPSRRAIQAIVRFSFFAPSGHLLNSTCPV